MTPQTPPSPIDIPRSRRKLITILAVCLVGLILQLRALAVEVPGLSPNLLWSSVLLLAGSCGILIWQIKRNHWQGLRFSSRGIEDFRTAPHEVIEWPQISQIKRFRSIGMGHGVILHFKGKNNEPTQNKRVLLLADLSLGRRATLRLIREQVAAHAPHVRLDL